MTDIDALTERVFDRLNALNAAGRIEYADYSALHDDVSALVYAREQSRPTPATVDLLHCPQAIHGQFQRTPNEKCPWCEWENLMMAQAATVEAVAQIIESYEPSSKEYDGRYSDEGLILESAPAREIVSRFFPAEPVLLIEDEVRRSADPTEEFERFINSVAYNGAPGRGQEFYDRGFVPWIIEQRRTAALGDAE